MAKRNAASGSTEGARLKPRPQAVLLELSGEWIKLIEVKGSRSGLELVRAYFERLDSETVVAESLRAAFKQQKFTALPMLCSIPRQLVNVRLLELPSVDSAEIADMVELQVGRQTPYSLHEILSDFKLVGHTRQGTYTRVLLAIVQRSIVRERYYAVESAGSSIDRMGLSSEGVITWFLYHTRSESPEKTFMVLDVDSFFTHMMVVRHRKVIFTKSLLWGTKNANAGAEGFVSRIQDALRSCEDVLQGRGIDKILVSGARSARQSDMLDAVSSGLGIPAEGVEVLDDVTIAPLANEFLSDDARDSVSLTGLLGMAMSPDSLSLHFVPDVFDMRQRILSMSHSWASIVSALAALLVAGSLYFSLASWTRVKRLEALRVENALYAPEVQQIERMVEVLRATRTRQDAQIIPEEVLPVLHAALPDGVYLDEFVMQIEEGRFGLRGSAPARKDIRDFIRNLEEAPYFSGVEEGGGTAMDNTQRFRFEVGGDMRGWQP